MEAGVAVDQFAEAVRAFQSIVSTEPLIDRDVLRALLELLLTASDLPDVEPDTVERVAAPPALNDEARAVFGRAAASFPDTRYYWEVFDPTFEHEGDAALGDLADDLEDIHRDLMRGLALFDSGEINDAVWEWRWSYRKHWGSHAVSAVRALHWTMYGPSGQARDR